MYTFLALLPVFSSACSWSYMFPTYGATPTSVLIPKTPWFEPTITPIPTLEPINPNEIAESSPSLYCADRSTSAEHDILVLTFSIGNDPGGYFYRPLHLEPMPEYFYVDEEGRLTPVDELKEFFIPTGIDRTYSLKDQPDFPDQIVNFGSCLVDAQYQKLLKIFFERYPQILDPIPFQEGI